MCTCVSLVVEDEALQDGRPSSAACVREDGTRRRRGANGRRTPSGWDKRSSTTRSCSTWMPPGLDGVSVCRAWRENGVWTPVLVLTARAGVEDRVAGLDAGADDYLPKPFSFAELNARAARASRAEASPERPAVCRGRGSGDSTPARRGRSGAGMSRSSSDEASSRSSRRRCARRGFVLSRLQLLGHAWDYAYENRSNVVDVYIRYSPRRSIGPPGRESIGDRPRAGLPAAEGRLVA